jgi:Domain of Unknown Function (DUF350)
MHAVVGARTSIWTGALPSKAYQQGQPSSYWSQIVSFEAGWIASHPRCRRSSTMPEILTAYLVTFGWAIVGSVSMGIGIIIALKLFDLSTRNVDEWELIKQGNIAMAIILASVIIALGIVVSAAIHP